MANQRKHYLWVIERLITRVFNETKKNIDIKKITNIIITEFGVCTKTANEYLSTIEVTMGLRKDPEGERYLNERWNEKDDLDEVSRIFNKNKQRWKVIKIERNSKLQNANKDI